MKMPSAAFDRLWSAAFRHAKENSPYYRELFAGIAGVPRIEELPTTDKQTLSRRNMDFLCVPRERVVEIVTTSGTTGSPLVWMLTESDVRRLSLNEKISFECAGFSPGETVIVAVALDRCFIAGLAYILGLRELGCAVARVGPSSPLLVLEMIERFKPAGIVAVPSFLRVIADKARETGFDLKNCPVTKAVCIGEPIRNAALELNVSGRSIEESWGARVFSTYGVTELANSLCECPAGAGGHLHDEMVHVEILDDAGRAVPDGEVGEIVATTFGVEAMPVIRYRTGDCAALYHEPCACELTTPRLGPIIGRKNQRLKYKGTSLFPSALQAVLEQADGVQTFVIIARKESELSDSIEVLVNGPAADAAVCELLQARTKVKPQVRHASREEIDALQMPPQARKRRLFVDMR